jgi:hypothetical protein
VRARLGMVPSGHEKRGRLSRLLLRPPLLQTLPLRLRLRLPRKQLLWLMPRPRQLPRPRRWLGHLRRLRRYSRLWRQLMSQSQPPLLILLPWRGMTALPRGGPSGRVRRGRRLPLPLKPLRLPHPQQRLLRRLLPPRLTLRGVILAVPPCCPRQPAMAVTPRCGPQSLRLARLTRPQARSYRIRTADRVPRLM